METNRARLLSLLMALAAAILAMAGAVRAENSLETLLMPGPVIAGHAGIESDCDACHKPFSKAAQDGLCLDCHKPVKADIGERRGFHGRSPLLKGLTCNACHTDHAGRDADIVRFDPALFDHAAADFALAGAHRDVTCGGCHAADKRWAEAPGTCFGCHEAGQPHQGRLGKQCETCHTAAAWRDTLAFDHAKTDFALRGKHREEACASCHLGEIYRGLGKTCNDCHVVQDVHQQRFGTACQSCHTELKWQDAKFDHAAETMFPLKGAHAKATCAACHGASALAKISTACAACHAAQDVHKKQQGESCGDCHAETAWRKDVRFDHGLTAFPLAGLHAATACESCHATPAFKDAGIACKDCHARDDVHAGRFTPRCESCHAADTWARTDFDHRRQTRFPLTGKHASTGCYNCHVRKNAADASLPADCYSCHAKQDVHRGKFGRNCASCHDASTFSTAFIRR